MILKTIKDWYQNRYQNNEPIVFVGLMLFFYLVLTFLGDYIAPILAALVIAYLLDTLVNILQKFTKLKRNSFSIYCLYFIFDSTSITNICTIAYYH